MENVKQYAWRSAEGDHSWYHLYDYSICDHFSGSETLQTAERTYAVLHVPDHSSAFVVHGDLDFEFYESLLHDPGLFQGDLPEALSGVYLFGAEAVDLFAVAMCLANGAIMVLEIPSFGIAASIQSLITCLVTFGDAEGYARNLEIHDLTFVFGQLVLYYVVFAPKDTRRERKKRWRMILLCTFFFLVGMKRIAIPAVVLFVVHSFFL